MRSRMGNGPNTGLPSTDALRRPSVDGELDLAGVDAVQLLDAYADRTHRPASGATRDDLGAVGTLDGVADRGRERRERCRHAAVEREQRPVDEHDEGVRLAPEPRRVGRDDRIPAAAAGEAVDTRLSSRLAVPARRIGGRPEAARLGLRRRARPRGSIPATPRRQPQLDG